MTIHNEHMRPIARVWRAAFARPRTFISVVTADRVFQASHLLSLKLVSYGRFAHSPFGLASPSVAFVQQLLPLLAVRGGHFLP